MNIFVNSPERLFVNSVEPLFLSPFCKQPFFEASGVR